MQNGIDPLCILLRNARLKKSPPYANALRSPIFANFQEPYLKKYFEFFNSEKSM